MYTQPPKKGSGFVTALLISLVFVFGVAMIWVLMNGAGEGSLLSPSVSPTPSAAPEATATPLPYATAVPTVKPSSTPAAAATVVPLDPIDDSITAFEKRVADVAQNAKPSVVGISIMVEGYEDWQFSGSGVVYDADNGYIVTNNHVISSGTDYLVTLSDGRQISAALIGADSVTDIAVLQLADKDNLVALPIGDSGQMRVGETVLAVGNPISEQLYGTVTRGCISSNERQITINNRRMTLLQTDAAINSGNSGGALVNLSGEWIGIPTLKVSSSYSSTTVEGLAFAIPINEVIPIVQQLLSEGAITRPGLGISGGTVDSSVAEEYDLRVNYGVYVSSVQQGSAAYKAGIEEGDVIIGFQGEQITSFVDLTDRLYACQIGDVVTITVNRSGRQADFTVTLEVLASSTN